MEGKNRMEQGNVLDGLHEECGVFGIYDFDGKDVASSRYIMVCSHYSTEGRKAAVLPSVIQMVRRGR